MNAEAYMETQAFPWWLILLEGISALILGIFLFLAPGATLLVLVQFTGFYWLVKGIFQIVSIFIDNTLWGWKLFAGILGVIAGIFVVRHPLWSSLVLPATVAIIVGIQGIVVGIVNLILAFKGGGWGMGIVGALSILFGLILIFNPLISGAALVLFIAAAGVIGGIVAIVMAFRVRKA